MMAMPIWLSMDREKLERKINGRQTGHDYQPRPKFRSGATNKETSIFLQWGS